RPVQRRGQQAWARCRLSDADNAPVLRRDPAGTGREDDRRARSHGVAAGVEHDPPVVAGMDAAMTLSRRQVLKLGLTAASHPLLPLRGIASQVFATSGAADVKFLLVFLRGGYDAASAVVPVGSDFYYESRPTIALPKPDPANPDAAIPLARPEDAVVWGLH